MLRTILLLLLFIPFLSFSQKITIQGTVTSSSEILSGVNVIEKGTSNGVVTDFDGNYSITANPNSTLVYSYIGYKQKEISIAGKTSIQVNLEEDASQLDEVLITGFGGVIGQARRRAESVQSIPESVVTFTSEDIEAKGITNVQSFSDQVPNVNFTTSQNVGNNFITVRGISHIRNGESPIAFVIDGVTLPDANLISQELFDLALIEVVKGPQGALYGKNAIAGAINITTNQPTNNFKNKVSFGYAQGNLLKGQLSSSGPLVKDKLFYRVSGSYKKGDGLIINKTLDKPVDFIEDLTLRGQVKSKLTESITATGTVQVMDTKGGSTYYATPITDETPGDLIGNVSPDNFDNQEIVADQFGVSTLKGLYGNLKVDFGFDKMKLVSSTTYNKGERNHAGDLDFTAVDFLRQIQDSDSKTINQELKLSSINNDDSKLSWDIGAFYQKSDKLLKTSAFIDSSFDPSNLSGVMIPLAVGDYTNTYNTLAAFGFLDYKVSDRFTMSFGLRYDNDDISQDNRTENTKPQKSDSQLQPKISLSLKATENMLMYANYGRGYRSGGFNQGETVRYDKDYEAEITDNYEIGIKNNYWNDRLILNLATYYIDFTNQQQYALVLDGVAGNILIGNFNFEKSKSYGFEADFKLRAAKYLDILAGYGVSHSKIIEGTSTYSTGANESFNVAGKNTPFIPQDSFTLGLESSFNITDDIAFNSNVTYKGTGEIYWHEDNDAVSSSYELLNARVGFSFNNISLNLWGNNVLGQQYITEYFGQSFSNGGSDLTWKGNPETYGIDLSYKF